MEDRSRAERMSRELEHEVGLSLGPCFADVLRRNNSSGGTMTVLLFVGENRVVADACIEDSTLNDDATAVCVLARLRGVALADAHLHETLRVPFRVGAY